MSTISGAPIVAHGVAGQSWASGLVPTLRHWWVSYITWRLQQAPIIALNSMSDRELKDIGLTRSEIIGAVRREPAHD